MKGKILRVLYVLLILVLITVFGLGIRFGYLGSTYQTHRRFPIDFNQPTGVIQAPGDSSELYISEQPGRILRVENTRGVSDYDVFLDISDQVFVGSEDGLIGMAFHHDYPNTPKFYTFHSSNNATCDPCITTMLSSYDVNLDTKQVNVSSQQVLISISHTTYYHRGGNLVFGPDNYLYVNIGDSSRSWVAQDLSNLYGSILRIDVDTSSESLPYGIPESNPFVDDPEKRGEIIAYGMRNPFRGDFDRETGDFWFGDVGNELYEEVNKLEIGANYGWPYFEGLHCRQNCTDIDDWNRPLIAYPHPNSSISGFQYDDEDLDEPYGISVVGSTIYRGSDLEDLQGKLVMTDYLGLVYSVDTSDGSTEFMVRFPTIVSSVAQDVETNELYFVGIGAGKNVGRIYTISKSIPFLMIGSVTLIASLILVPIIRQYRANRSKPEISDQ